MEPRSKLRKVIFFCLLLSLFGMVAFGYFCPDQYGEEIAHSLMTNLSVRDYNTDRRCISIVTFGLKRFRLDVSDRPTCPSA
ncbi:hypothetical protein RR48_10929 [Papilio machaon]|uniref:Uncharacterized protein n=1 Tax=Papilio machaon TaxID=76193 RepID=A0A194R913_PAPMA|nr:hypothetical protein RR48_10929 [Papilio machaon]